eukprot:RCo001192
MGRPVCLLLTAVVVMGTLLGLANGQDADCVEVTIYHSAPCVPWQEAIAAASAAASAQSQGNKQRGGTYTDPYADLYLQANDYNSPMCRCFRYAILTCDPPMSQFDIDLSKCLNNAVGYGFGVTAAVVSVVVLAGSTATTAMGATTSASSSASPPGNSPTVSSMNIYMANIQQMAVFSYISAFKGTLVSGFDQGFKFLILAFASGSIPELVGTMLTVLGLILLLCVCWVLLPRWFGGHEQLETHTQCFSNVLGVLKSKQGEAAAGGSAVSVFVLNKGFECPEWPGLVLIVKWKVSQHWSRVTLSEYEAARMMKFEGKPFKEMLLHAVLEKVPLLTPFWREVFLVKLFSQGLGVTAGAAISGPYPGGWVVLSLLVIFSVLGLWVAATMLVVKAVYGREPDTETFDDVRTACDWPEMHHRQQSYFWAWRPVDRCVGTGSDFLYRDFSGIGRRYLSGCGLWLSAFLGSLLIGATGQHKVAQATIGFVWQTMVLSYLFHVQPYRLFAVGIVAQIATALQALKFFFALIACVAPDSAEALGVVCLTIDVLLLVQFLWDIPLVILWKLDVGKVVFEHRVASGSFMISGRYEPPPPVTNSPQWAAVTSGDDSPHKDAALPNEMQVKEL